MPTLCAAINSVQWLLTSFLRKKKQQLFLHCFCIRCKTGTITAQLMSTTKIVGQSYTNFQASYNLLCLYILVCFQSGQKPQRHAFSLGLNNDLFLHLCIKEGTDQLRSYRAADQHFCFRFKEHISRHCECMNRNFQLAA